MKKILFLALALVATASCKRDVDLRGIPVEPEQGVEIALSAGAGITAEGSRTGAGGTDDPSGIGEREIFELSDKIGLFAAYKIADAAEGNVGGFKPDWTAATAETLEAQTGRYFDNKPAICTTAGILATAEPVVEAASAEFGWGIDVASPGGRDITQTYPRNSKDIYLFAYYPYDATIDNTTLTDGPVVPLTLNEKTMAETPVANSIVIYTDGLFTAVQSDVLYARGASVGNTTEDAAYTADLPYVNRLNMLKTLQFEHALAQFNIELSKDAGAAQAYLVELTLKTYKTANMQLSHDPAQSGKVTPTGEPNAITYTITPDWDNSGVLLIPDESTPLLDKHLMLFPLSNANLALCELEIVVYSGVEEPTMKPTTDLRTYTIPLKDLKVAGADPVEDFALEAGQLNKIILKLTTADIIPTAVIEPWNTAGSEGGIVVE